MTNFKILIEEHVVQTFDLQASSDEEAMEIAQKKYYSGEFVLEPGDVSTRLIAIDKPNNYVTEWIEF